MAAPTIIKGEEHFFPIIYSGNGQGQRVGNFIPFTDQATIAKSVMYNDGDSPYLTRTQESGSGDQKRKATFSWWFKRGTNYGAEMIHVGSAPSTRLLARFDTSDRLVFRLTNGTTEYQKVTNMTFKDSSKWYHCVWAIDVSQSTATDRSKVYIDGQRITSWSSDNNPAQNTDVVGLADGTTQRIGCGAHFVGQIFDGYLAEFNYIDNQVLLPASFGITDTSTGRWIPKTVEPFPTTTTDIAVTVVSSGGNKYALDGVTQGTVTLIEGATYKFDQSDSSNSGHPLRFSTTSDGTHGGGSEFTSGVTTSGTPGSSGAYTEITVPTGTATLYYYCTNHSGMGGTANTQDQYGSNGFRLQFQDSSALGDDTSGNTNDFTSSGLTASDQRTDTPTNNLPIMRPYNPSYSQILYEGNLTHYTNGTNKGYPMPSTLRPRGSGKYYAECRVSGDGGGNTVDLGVYTQEDMHNYSSGNWYPGNNNGSGWNSAVGYGSRGFYQQVNNTNTYVKFISETMAAGDVIGMALDLDNGQLSYYNNSGSLVGSVPVDSTKTLMFAGVSNTSITFIWNFGDNGTFSGNETAGGNADEDGNGNFYHSVPSGFKMLRQDSMPETGKGIPGLVWVKDTDGSGNFHTLNDSSRGSLLEVYANSDSAQATQPNSIKKFLKGGYSVMNAGNWNYAGNRFCAWNWVGNGGTTATNSNGSITSTVQANTTAGFSIVQYTGTGSNGSVGHGLSQAPEWIMVKILNLNSVAGFTVSTTADPNGFNNYLYLNETEVSRAYDNWQNTAPTNSVFTVSSSTITNYSSQAMLAYCWHSVDGFSKFGRYKANGNADGPFVYTGFKPAFVMIKNIDSAYSWGMFDNKRDPDNPVKDYLAANSTAVSGSQEVMDFLSNGFKMRISGSSWTNNSTDTHVYMAFAENPFVGDGTSPVTAR
jgi:hypothetical protein|tara:strand:- start:3807 stop:6581 length:2775 start_codon:yes stop_codon:yes gene_type:complete